MNKTTGSILSFLLFSAALTTGTPLQAQSYNGAESAEYDPFNNRWLVSNGNIVSDDGNGNLAFFGNNTSANYGMEIYANTLFAVDGNGITAYDLTSEEQIGRVIIPGAGFLNGLTADRMGKLWVTDFSSRKIYEIDANDVSNMTQTTVIANTVNTPNGIVYDGPNNRLIFTGWGSNAKIKAIDLTNYSISTLITTSLGSIDGIDDDASGNFYISSWNPARISRYDNDFANAPETITTPFISSPADIGYSQETDSLAIPIGSNVVFIGFEPISSVAENLSAEEFGFKVYPNPISHQSYLEFDLPFSADVSLTLVNQSGQVVRNLLSGRQNAGNHKVLLAGHDLPSGNYSARLTLPQGQLVERVIVVR